MTINMTVKYDPMGNFPCSDGKIEDPVNSYIFHAKIGDTYFETASRYVLYRLRIVAASGDIVVTIRYNDKDYDIVTDWQDLTKDINNEQDYLLEILLELIDIED